MVIVPDARYSVGNLIYPQRPLHIETRCWQFVIVLRSFCLVFMWCVGPGWQRERLAVCDKSKRKAGRGKFFIIKPQQVA